MGSIIGPMASAGGAIKQVRDSRKNAPYSGRLQRFSRLIAENGLPWFLVTNPKDVAYLTGFFGGDSYLLFGPKRPTVISDFRFQEELDSVRPWCNVVIRTGPMAKAVAEQIVGGGGQRLGVQGEHMTLGVRQAIGLQVRGVKLIETTGLVGKLRVRKDAGEVATIRRAVRLQEEALNETLEWMDRRIGRPGKPLLERDVAAQLEFAMRVRGISEPGFQTIVASGANGSLPHYRAGAARVRKGTPLLVDWGSVYRGYHGDLTRVVCWGRWPGKIAEIYAIVQDAQAAAAARLAPGRTTREIDSVARDLIARAGYGEHFGHGLGHGLGLDGHEDPRLSHMAEPSVLEPGHVVTVEPGIYLPGVGGVRIEDDYLITSKGSERLSALPRDLKWATR
jgi:Xaa-Pro aminopeptidase